MSYIIEQFSIYEAIRNNQQVHQNVNGWIVKDQTKTSVYYVIEQYVIHHIKYIINSPIKERIQWTVHQFFTDIRLCKHKYSKGIIDVLNFNKKIYLVLLDFMLCVKFFPVSICFINWIKVYVKTLSYNCSTI